jgi:hypothetical protein
MMNTLEFLRRVLPDDGYYAAFTVLPEGGKVRFFSTREDLSDFLQILSNKKLNAYYAISSFKLNKGRKQENVYYTKILAIDVDVGKPRNSYAKRKEALKAIHDFVQAAGLPMPMILSSGMGFHAYWVLTRPLPPEEWMPLAAALKQLWQSHGLVADPAVTGDSARVLRAPGTYHISDSGEREVTVLLDAPPCDPDVIAKLVTPKPKRTSTLINNLAVNQDWPEARANAVATKCGQVAAAIKNPENVDEPLWYALLGVAAYTTNPEETAIEWSKGHPEFSEIDTLKKLSQWKTKVTGPTTCEKFASLNPDGCKSCKYKGNITSPVQLGKEYQEAPPAPDAPDQMAHDIPVPAPFKRTKSGMKLTVDETDIDICPFEIYPVSYGLDEVAGYEVVRYHWKRPHRGWVELKFRQAYLTESLMKDFSTTIADQGIVLYNRKVTEYFQLMLRSYMEELRRVKDLTNLYSSMGWKDNYKQFVLGDTVIHADESGTVVEDKVSIATSSLSSVDYFTTAGTRDVWVDGTAILEKANMPAHMFCLGMSFSAPLFALTGLRGMTVSLYGPTGSGKTLAQLWAQSIWGNPDQLHYGAKYTQNALFHRMGLYANLPMTIDEATMMDDSQIGDFLYWVSQGKDKARLSRAADERSPKTWALPVIVSTNKSLQSKLLTSGYDTDAQVARLLELTITSNKLFVANSNAGAAMYKHITSNYGLVGREFIKHIIGLGEEQLRSMLDDHKARFATKYKAKFSGQERYWEQAVLLQDFASEIAAGLGLLKYDYAIGTQWALAQLGVIRKSVAENKSDSFDLLADYINDNADAAVTVTYTGTGKGVADFSRIPRSDVRIRYELYRPTASSKFTKGIMYIHRTHFRRWLTSINADYKTFAQDMDSAQAVVRPPYDKVSLGKDTPIKTGQSYVLGFDLNTQRLANILNDTEEAFEAGLLTKLKVVQ